jgi:DNA-directed RNA polymerase specialized sigma24 family protein
VQPDRLGRIAVAHATARLTAAQRRAIQLRYSDGHLRHGTAQLADRSTEAVRDLEQRGLHRHQAALTAAPDPVWGPLRNQRKARS